MKKAKVGKRIGAFFIDALILGIIASLITSFLEDPAYLEQLAAIEEAYFNGSMDFLQYSDAIAALVDPNLWLKTLVELVLLAAYYVVLPIFWSEQTLGRKLMKIKVVAEDNSPAKPVNFIVREGFGQTLFAYVFMVLSALINNSVLETVNSLVSLVLSFILLIGFFSMCGEKKTTLYDRWSKTKMVSTEGAVLEDELDIIKPTEEKQEDIIDLE